MVGLDIPDLFCNFSLSIQTYEIEEQTDTKRHIGTDQDGQQRGLRLGLPPLNIFINRELKRHRLYTKENQEDVFQDTLEEFIRKPIIPNDAEPIAYLIGFAKIVIKRIQRFNGLEKDKLPEYAKKMKAQRNEEQILDTQEYEICIESIKLLIEQLPPANERVMVEKVLHSKQLSYIFKQFNYKSMKVLYAILSQSRKKLLELIDNSPNHSILKEFINNTNKKNGKR